VAEEKVRRSPEVEAVFRRLWRAFVEGSEAAFRNLLSNDAGFRIILSADENWYAGPDLAPMFAERGRLMDVERLEFERLEAYEKDDVGWVAAEVTVTMRSGRSATFRTTTALIVEDGMWKAIQIHTSVGVPQADVFGVELDAGLSALIASLEDDAVAEISDLAGASGVVTLMFTDIEDSTRLSAERGDARWSQDIQAHLGAVEQIVTGHGGRVVKTLGDGSMAAFSSATGAAGAAFGIQQMESDAELRVRIGVHTGEAVAIGDDYAGIAVAKAARVASAAHGGEVLISSATRELLDRFTCETGPERVVELKGLPGTHRLIPLLSLAP
jgi:adenylate cyclase